MIQIDDEPFWLYAAVDPATNHVLHIRLFPRRTIAMTAMFLRELRQKHDIDNALFRVDGAPWLQTALDRHSFDFRHQTHGDRNAVERLYREVKRRTYSFSNTFSHVDPETAKTWLLALARRHNSLN